MLRSKPECKNAVKTTNRKVKIHNKQRQGKRLGKLCKQWQYFAKMGSNKVFIRVYGSTNRCSGLVFR